jgi:hypothetical protein
MAEPNYSDAIVVCGYYNTQAGFVGSLLSRMGDIADKLNVTPNNEPVP